MIGDPSFLGASFRYLDRLVTIPAAGTNQLCVADSQRVALWFSTSSLQAYIRPNQVPVGTAGIGIQSGMSPVGFHFRSDGGLVQQAWFGQAPVGADVYVLEILFQPVREG